MTIELDETIKPLVAKYHVLMMVHVALHERGATGQANMLYEMTRDLRHDMADRIIYAIVESLSSDTHYKSLFDEEENNLYKSVMLELRSVAPLQ